MKIKKYAVMFIATAILTVMYFMLITTFRTTIILQSSVQVAKMLQYASFIGIIINAAIGIRIIIILMKNITRNISEKHAEKISNKEIQADPIKRLVYEINIYIKENRTTSYFEENLGVIAMQLPSLKKQVESIDIVIKHRFGENSISYNEFINPVNNLFSHLTKLVADLIQKLMMFDEARYELKINELRAKSNNSVELAEYEEVMQHYINFVEEILINIEKTTMRLDKLVLEISKLSDEELHKSIAMLDELNRVIINTKLYK